MTITLTSWELLALTYAIETVSHAGMSEDASRQVLSLARRIADARTIKLVMADTPTNA